MISLAWLLITIITFLIVYLLLLPDEHQRILGNRIPGPKPLLFVGNTILFLRSKSFLEMIIGLHKEYGNIYRYWIGRQCMVVLSNPDDIEVILSSIKYIKKGDSYKVLSSWLGDGLITSTAEIWRFHRKLLTPTFHFKILEDAVNVFHNNSEILVTKLADNVDKDDFNIQHYIELCNLDIICESAMGITLNTQTSEDLTYINAIKDASTAAINRMFVLWLHPEIMFRFSNTGKLYYEALKYIKMSAAKVIKARSEQLFKNGTKITDAENNCIDGKKKPLPFLDLLLTGGYLSDQEIEDEVQSFLFAGHDTVTAAASFCIYALANNQSVQDKAAEESKEILSSPLTIQTITNLRYIEMVIRESMRIYSPVPMIARQVEEDIKLPSGYTLPAGCLANMHIIGMHNREDLFPNPTKFDPERFSDNLHRHPYSYIPFSAGPRNCIGQKYAMLEIKVLLATLLKNYKFLTSEKYPKLSLENQIVLRSKGGIPIRITKRV